jgi:hypothetical protein
LSRPVRDDVAVKEVFLFRTQVRAGRLRLEVECALELVAGARGVAPEYYPVVFAAPILVAQRVRTGFSPMKPTTWLALMIRSFAVGSGCQ